MNWSDRFTNETEPKLIVTEECEPESCTLEKIQYRNVWFCEDHTYMPNLRMKIK